MESESCKVFLRDQILNAFKLAFSNMSLNSAILITDDKTTNILDTCLKVHQLNDLGIGAVLNIKYKRERVRVPPIYFLSPSVESIKAVVKDYENSKQPQYASSAHLFICSSITKESMELLKTSNLRRHLKTFQEVYCDFHALESRVFHFNRPEAFHNLYMNAAYQKAELQETAENLFSLCVSLEEHPYIRHARDSPLAHNLAQLFEGYFRNKKAEMKQFKPQGKRAMLIIVDRTQDPVAPLVHEITYQAMIKDLIPTETKYIPLEKPVDDGAKDGAKDAAKTTRFYYDDDPMWADFRHKNLPDVLKVIQKKFKDFKATNRIAMQQLQEEKENDNLLRSVRDIPKYKMMTKSFNSHFEIKDKLVQLYKSLDLKKIAEIEQSLITGLDDQGKHSKMKTIQTDLSHVLRDVTIGADIKMRLLLVYIISQGGLNEKQQKALFSASDLSPKQEETIFNIGKLGVTTKAEGKTSKKSPFYSDMHSRAKKLSKSDVFQSRFEPLIATLLRKFDNGELSEADFPFCGEQEDSRNITGTFGGRSLRKRVKSGTRNNKSKIIVFMIGGVCYSEIRQCYLLASELKREIFIGSSHVMSPKEYINLLKGPDKKPDTLTIDVKEDDEP